MTRDPRLLRLVPSGQAKFSRAHVNKRSTTDSRRVCSSSENRQPPTPDSGFFDGAGGGGGQGGNGSGGPDADYGVASVIHVIEPDVTAARDWWHTRGYKSDPYADGRLPPPEPLRPSQAAQEAQTLARKTAETRAAWLQQSAPRLDSSKEATSLSLLEAVQIRPISSREDTQLSVTPVLLKECPDETEKTNPPVIQTISAGVAAANASRRTTRRKHGLIQSTEGKWLKNKQSVISGSKTLEDENIRGSSTTGLSTGVTDQVRPSDKNTKPSKTNKIRNAYRQSPREIRATVRLKTTPRAYEGVGVRVPSRESEGNLHISQQTPSVTNKRARPSSVPLEDSTQVKARSQPRSRPVPITAFHTSKPKSPPSSRKQAASRRYPSLATRRKASQQLPTSSNSTDVPSRWQTQKEAPGDNDVTVETDRSSQQSVDRHRPRRPDEKVKFTRKVSFLSDEEQPKEKMNQKEMKVQEAGNSQITNLGKRQNPPPRARTRKKKTLGKPTQRQLDNDVICNVALANRLSRQDQRADENTTGKDKENQPYQGTSESEDDEDAEGTKQETRPKNSWELFEEQVKSIDDGCVSFNTRDLTSKSSDLFEKVMCEVGPQFRKPKPPSHSEAARNNIENGNNSDQDGEVDGEDRDVFMGDGSQSEDRSSNSPMSRFKTKRGWGLLRKTMLDIQMQTGKSAEASRNWSFLCTTINNMTDMQRGREALYKKYIYEPNSWMRGFTNQPANVLRNSVRRRGRDSTVSVRGVQSANGQRTVVVGHQVDEMDPNNVPEGMPAPPVDPSVVKLRARSSQGRITVASFKSSVAAAGRK